MEKHFHVSYRNVPQTREQYYKTIPDLIYRLAEAQPKKEAVVFMSGMSDRRSVTFKQVCEKSEEFAKALVNFGIKKGDIVGMNISNSPEFLYAMFGAMMAGAIPIAISFTFSDGSDVVGLINKLENCRIFVLDPGENDRNWITFKPLLNEFRTNGDVISAKMSSLEKLVFVAPPKDKVNALTMENMIENINEATKLPTLDPEDIAILFQTSGSTGIPKAVAHTHHSLISGCKNGLQVTSSAEDTVYNERQFGWMGGFPFNFLLDGYTLVTRSLQSSDGIEGAEYFLRAVHQENCTVALALPPVIRELVQRKDDMGPDWGLHTIITGGQPISKFYAMCTGVVCKTLKIVYASTETVVVTECLVDNIANYEEYSSGTPNPGYEIKFVDEDGCVIPVNTRGELWIRGPSVFLCYYNDPQRTQRDKTENGWYKTDDIGYMTEKGSVFIEGRKSDTIVSGGLDVAPAILESLLRSIQGVKDAHIVPLPHPELFQVICACIVKMEGSDITEESVRDHVEKRHLDKQRAFTVLPAHYLLFDKFPLTRTGKVSKKNLVVEASKRLKDEQHIVGKEETKTSKYKF